MHGRLLLTHPDVPDSLVEAVTDRHADALRRRGYEPVEPESDPIPATPAPVDTPSTDDGTAEDDAAPTPSRRWGHPAGTALTPED